MRRAADARECEAVMGMVMVERFQQRDDDDEEEKEEQEEEEERGRT